MASLCEMKIKLYKTFNTLNNSHPSDRLLKIKIFKYLTKRERAVLYTKHNYTTEYLNIIMINSSI